MKFDEIAINEMKILNRNSTEMNKLRCKSIPNHGVVALATQTEAPTAGLFFDHAEFKDDHPLRHPGWKHND